MKTKILLSGLFAILSFVVELRTCGGTPELYARQALSTNASVASNAIVRLREFGSEGLNALFKAHEPFTVPFNKDDAQWLRLRAAFDAVGGQRDCHASRLFWHTNFADAQGEARRTGKPILSLRLLGKLDEELSCANSRFFRTTLYANKEVSGYLRDHFVLHWKSVRPVPRITIDMGDGRKIERTITGNSVHYVLDSNGEIVDALPGLYGPKAFLTGLRNAEQVAKFTVNFAPAARSQERASFHLARLNDINRRWDADLKLAKAQAVQVPRPVAVSNQVFSMANAMSLTVTKSVAEIPMLRAMIPAREQLARATDDALWTKIAALHQDDAKLDASSTDLIRAKTLTAEQAMRLTLSKARVEDPMLKTIQNLQRSIAEDTVRNEYTFHAIIHEWLATPGAAMRVEKLNARVYAELFLTPDSDPWLGLAPADTFSALENSGLVSGVRAQ